VKTLSLVIPVYNAPDLARATLPHIPELAACAADCGFELTEAIFVDDGSEPPLDISRTGETPVLPVRILRQPQNRGKGAAVRRGALEAKGDWVLMSDVDLSAPLTEFARLAPQADAWMVCGSRYGRAGMPLRRRILSRLFHALVWLVGVRGIQDTQCGFKLFRMEKMRPIFEAQRIERFSFDVELVRRVLRAGGTVVEASVDWHGGKRSSLRVLRDAPRMLWDLLRTC
jgi:dolichyl-phosphate beta-glucosyltransferase